MDAKVSLLMVEWNRRELMEKTLESIHRQDYPNLEIVCITDCRKRTRKWMNPAPLWNQAIRASTGDILIIQNPECLHITPDVIQQLVAPHVEPYRAVFASTLAMPAQDGTYEVKLEHPWYCHPTLRPKPWFFCGSIRKRTLLDAGGFDESFTEYGGEDMDLVDKMSDIGVEFRWLPPETALVHHQWHGYPEGMWENAGA